MTPTDTQIRTAAEDVAWKTGEGGYCLYWADDMSGGEWYSGAACPSYDPTKAVKVAVPTRGVRGSEAITDAVAISIRSALARADEFTPIYQDDVIVGWVR